MLQLPVGPADRADAAGARGAQAATRRRRGSRRPPRISRIRFNTFSFRSGKCRSSQFSNIGATTHGNRSGTHAAEIAPAFATASNMAGIS